MFHTCPEAELILPAALAPFGEKSWHWIEFSLQLPYYFLSVSVESEEGSFRRHFLFSQLRDVLGLIATSKDDISIKEIEIALLSPGYMNGSGSYQLGKIKEIWECRRNREQTFVMSDGARYHYPSDIGRAQDQEKELVLSL